jgi:hypothetical protein
MNSPTRYPYPPEVIRPQCASVKAYQFAAPAHNVRLGRRKATQPSGRSTPIGTNSLNSALQHRAAQEVLVHATAKLSPASSGVVSVVMSVPHTR